MSVYAQLARGFRNALRTAPGIQLTWERPVPLGNVAFLAIKNPLAPTSDGIDRNEGNNAPCKLTALVADLPAKLPEQGDTFIDDAGRSYRVGAIEQVPGHPLVSFTIAHVT